MPIYEYQCNQCGTRFEKMQPITAEPLRECINCGGPVRRVFHPVGVIFKGSGWYINDSRKPAQESKSTSDGKADSSSSSTDSSPAPVKDTSGSSSSTD